MLDRVQLGVLHILWSEFITVNIVFFIAVLFVTVVTTVVVDVVMSDFLSCPAVLSK